MPLRTVTLLLCLAGCEGLIGGGGLGSSQTGPATLPPLLLPDGTNATEPGQALVNPCTDRPDPPAVGLRRLAHDEYRFTVSDVLPGTEAKTAVGAAVASFPPDPISLNFKNNASFLEVNDVLFSEYFTAAESIAEKAVADLPTLLPCTAPGTTAGDLTCAQQFINRFGRLLYRRALSADEASAYSTLYSAARTRGDAFPTAIQGVVMAFLLSPNFLYRVEVDDAATGSVRPVSSVELASRLSYLLWRSAPDDTLLAQAERGELATPDQVEVAANRLLADPKASRFTQFFEESLDVDAIASLQRDTTIFPNLDAQLPQLFLEETQRFITQVTFAGDAKLSTLLTAPYTFVNGPLAQHYGISGVTGANFSKVSVTGQRGGLMTLAGPLVNHDKQNRTSIVNRGLKVRTQLLCQIVPAPPPNVPALGTVSADQTQADRLAQHRQDPACAGCHTRMDPLGSAFEQLDAVGRARTTDEHGRALSASGTLSGTDVDGDVTDARDLMSHLARSPMVHDCLVTNLSRFASGQKEASDNTCQTFQLKARFRQSGGNVKDLLVGLARSDDFRFRRVLAP